MAPRRPRIGLALGMLSTVTIMLVGVTAWQLRETGDDGTSPVILDFPEQTLVGGPVVTVARDPDGNLPDTFDIEVEGVLCNVGEVPVDTLVTLTFETAGQRPTVLTPEPLHQRREPGCEWRLADCPSDLAALEGPAPAISCLPPFLNTLPVAPVVLAEGRPWRVNGTADVVEAGWDSEGITTEPFEVTLAPATAP